MRIAIRAGRESLSLHRRAGCHPRHRDLRRLRRHYFRADSHHHSSHGYRLLRRCSCDSAENRNAKALDSYGSVRSTYAAASLRRSWAHCRTSAVADCKNARYCNLAWTAVKPDRSRSRIAHSHAPTADDSHPHAPIGWVHLRADSSFRSRPVRARDPCYCPARPTCVNCCRRAARRRFPRPSLMDDSVLQNCWAYCPDGPLPQESCGKTNSESSNADSWPHFRCGLASILNY